MKRLTVNLKILKRQIRLLDNLQASFYNRATGKSPEPRTWNAPRKALIKKADDLEGIANFLSELNAQLSTTGSPKLGVAVYQPQED
jgi:hypothetical protein